MKTDTLPVLETIQLGVSIGNATVCRGLNLTLHRGERLAVLGRNGAGKSTLLSVLAGLREPQTGQVLLDGSSYSQLGSRRSAQLRGWLGQHQTNAFASTVLEATLVGRYPHLSRWNWESEKDLLLVKDALSRVSLANFDQRDILSLSGGERQRQAIATLLTQAPQLYLLDEPTTHLDLQHQIKTLNLFGKLSEGSPISTEVSCIMVLHEPGLAVRFCSRALLLFGDGSFELGNCEKVVNASSLTRLYGYPLSEVSDGDRRWFMPA
jgi:iron complex transport system ATP-binding protein